MTSLTPVARQPRPAAVPWPPLLRVTWLRHRTALISFLSFGAVIALAMAVTGVVLHAAGRTGVFATWPHSRWWLFLRPSAALTLTLLSLPVLAGMFLGAPLVAREIETGTSRFTWPQGAGRTRPLVAALLPTALLLAVIGAVLGLEFRWLITPLRAFGSAWHPGLFSLNPLPLVGWTVFGFSLGVFLGALIRRTVPAMAAAFGCYAVLFYNVAISWQGWRYYYLPPMRLGLEPTFGPGGSGLSYGFSYGGRPGASADILSSALGWPDGRLLGPGQYNHSAAWFRLHHIKVWVTYQPGSRLGLFQVIEAGWLVALSAALIAATILLVRRRAV